MCMHKIIMEDDAKPIVESYIERSSEKEFLKWLNAGFIYAISDSTW